MVLLDATAEREQARRMQQKAYDITLLQEKEALLTRRLEAVNTALRATQRELHQRTDELARSVEELRALGEVSQAVNSTLDLETVLTTIVAKATQLSNTEAGAIYVFDDASREFRLRATYGMDDDDHRRDQGSSHPPRRDAQSAGLWSSARRSRFRTFRMIRHRFST